MLSEPHCESEAHHRIPPQDIRLVAQPLPLGVQVALDLVAERRARRRGGSALRCQRDGRRAAIDGTHVEEEMEAAARPRRIAPAEADIGRYGVAELELSVQRAELRAR